MANQGKQATQQITGDLNRAEAQNKSRNTGRKNTRKSGRA